MRSILSLTLLAFALVTSVPAHAAKAMPKKAKTKSQLTRVETGKSRPRTSRVEKKDEKLSTEVVFDGSMINGRYHTAGEAVTTVETEKQMNELVGFRRDFKDRLAMERARLKGQ